MPITAAEIEANGWVLRLTLTATLGSFASYTLAPDTTPRVTLTSSHPGFVKSGGQAVAGNLARTLVGTKPLRLPVNPASPTVKVIDETDLGGGSIRVRIALTEHIYATDTGLSLAVLAGWRTGEGAASGISVTNNSTCVAPIPIMRWALHPYEVTAGAFRVSMVVVSHHPVGFEPVAGVKFTATDGTNVKTLWVTALDTDNSYGDNLRCYTALIDPATAPALTAGLLRVDAEVYPWLGLMRTTDPAGTKLMTNARTDGFSTAAEAPWVIGYDPAGTRYSQQFAFVDPVNGTVTAAAGMVATTLADAKAVAPASRPRDVSTAVQAGYLANRTLAAANGQASQTRSIDGMQIVLAAGTHDGCGATAVTTGIATAEIPVRIVGDPDNVNPRANCILRTNVGLPRATRARWQTMTIEQGTLTLTGGVVIYNHLDNVELRGKSGQEGNAVAPFTSVPPAGQWNLSATRCKIWRTGVNFASGNSRVGVFRANEHTRTTTSFMIAVKNRVIGSTEDGFIGTGTPSAPYVPWASATLASQTEDLIVAYNSALFLRGQFFNGSRLDAAIAGTPNTSTRRNAIIGNVMVRIGNDSSPFWKMGEKESQTMSYNIIEGNTCAGDRSNTFYNDPLPRSLLLRGDTGVSANAIQSTAHGYANDNQVRYYTTLGAPTITGLTNGTTYFVVNATANSFQLATTLGGAPLTIAAVASAIVGQNFANITDVDTQQNQAFVNRVANNIFDWMPSKHDDFSDPAVQAARGTANGYRPQLVDCWSMVYGVGHEGNVLTQRAAARLATILTFTIEFTGLRTIDGYSGVLAPLYTDDKSIDGPDGIGALGGGDMTLQAGSPAMARVVRGNTDRDFVGIARQAPGAAGAYESLDVLITANGGVLGLVGAPVSVSFTGLGFSIAPEAGVLSLLGGAATVSFFTAGDYDPSVTRLGRQGVRLKPANAVIDYPIAWTLETGEAISSSTWSVSPSGGMAVVPGSVQTDGLVTACLVSGGVFRRVYSLINTITTSEGRTLVKSITVRIGPEEA
jgi:hypothetical protein